VLYTFDQKTKLNQELKSFGLNPSEWNVLKEKSQIYRVQSKADRNFFFQGKVQKKGLNLKWKQLELVSI
jgi:hypothetical protein